MSEWNKTIQAMLADPNPQPQPMTPDDTRERLARVSHLAYYGEDLERESQPEKDDWLRMIDAILAEQAATPRYGVYVNGDLWAECSDEGRAVLIMDALAASATDRTDSFDVMLIEKPDA